MIEITQQGVPQTISKLERVKAWFRRDFGSAIAEYLVGDMSHGLKHYVPYKYVSIAQSGGWKSEKQRRYVMAMIAEGKIDPGVPHRTGNMQRGWKYAEQGAGRWIITNAAPYTKWVVGVGSQTQMHAKQGWRDVAEVVRNNIKGALVHARAKLREFLRGA
jgi:hypothetical protein